MINNIGWAGMTGSACANDKPAGALNLPVHGLRWKGRETPLRLDKDQQRSRCQDKLRRWLIDNVDNASLVAGV
jgi:hypothetical protein